MENNIGHIITIGSDAYMVDRVGADVEDAIKIIKKCGFKKIAIFSHRTSEFCSIN